jgi:UDP-N-acetyl-D-glucosamine dehydrogenase
MPFYVADRILEVLGTNGIAASKANLLILGAAFKGNVEDTRHSPAIKVMELILDKVAKADYHDPWVPKLEIGARKFQSVPLTAQALAKADCVVILTDHKCFDYDFIFKHSRLILDARNAIKRRGSKKLYTLGNHPVKR